MTINKRKLNLIIPVLALVLGGAAGMIGIEHYTSQAVYAKTKVTTLKYNFGNSAAVIYPGQVRKGFTSPASAVKEGQITFKSSNAKIAKVDKKGNVTGIKVGKVTITAKSKNGKHASATIKIKAPSLTWSVGTKNLYPGYTTKASAKVNGSYIPNKKITYKSSNTKVATVSSKGSITGIGQGKAVITAKSAYGSTAKITVTSKYKTPTAVFLKTTAVNQFQVSNTGDILSGVHIIIGGQTAPLNSTYAKNPTSGIQFGINPKPAKQAATFYLTDQYGYKVDATGVSTVKVAANGSVIKPTDTTTPAKLTFKQQIAKIDATTGAITGLNPGVVYVHAKSAVNPKLVAKNTIPVQVKENKKSVVGYFAVDNLALTGKTSLPVGQTTQLTATTLPFNAKNHAVTFISSNPKVATISSTGVVKAVANGQTWMTAYSADGKSATLLLNIEPTNSIKATGIRLYGVADNKLYVNDVVALGTVITPSAAKSTVKYTSSAPTVVTVDQHGQVIGKNAGKATITVTTNGKSASVTLTVEQPAEKSEVAAPSNKTFASTTTYSQNPNNPLATSAWAVNYGWWDNAAVRGKYDDSLAGVGGDNVSQLRPNGTKYIAGPLDDYMHFTTAGSAHTLLKRIVSQPTSIYFTPGNSNKDTKVYGSELASLGYVNNPTNEQKANGIPQNTFNYFIQKMQRGNVNTLVQITTFGIFSVGGGEYSLDALSSAETNQYKQWIEYMSKGIGDSKVAITMEADAAMLASRPETPANTRKYADIAARKNLIKWATKYLKDNNPNAAIYLDAGDSDWLDTDDAVRLLEDIGIENARGFALGATHLSSTRDNINYAKVVSDKLATDGFANKKVIIDTADNGNGFTQTDYTVTNADTKGVPFGDPRTQTYAGQGATNVLGIAPTWQVGNATTGITGNLATKAMTYVDGYLWIGRPWLFEQTTPYNHAKALAAAQYTTDKTLLNIK